MRWALALVLAGCADSAVAIKDQPCPDAGTSLTYASFGAGFFADHCNRCHDEAKNGAPANYRFDTVDEIRTHAARIFIRAAGPNVTMPPGPDDPPLAARDELAMWLACGSP